MFFAEENNLSAIGNFLKKARSTDIEDNNRQKRLSTSMEIINYIYKNPGEWDERCHFNIKNIGEQFLKLIRGFDPTIMSDIDNLYSMAYRFLCEFDFLVGAGRQLSIELSIIKKNIQQDSEEMDENVRSQILYASYFMPASITKGIINDSNIGIFRSFEEKKNEAEKLKVEWDKELEQKKVETERLKEKLDEYKIAFNFVGLYQGFSNLAVQKKRESSKLFWALILMGLAILSPLIIELYCATNGLLDSTKLITLIPLLSIEVVLIYFFRVILLNHRSVDAQKIQIELRQTLCQFIQSYAEYSAKIKSKDSIALEKFESLIFSGILSNPEKLPSTFDGFEQLGEFVKKLKNP